MTVVNPIYSILTAWYARYRRDLPWREDDCTAWAVMVSEFMLQQTPVSRVLGPWQEWMRRWPTPADLASEPTSAAVLAWGRLGYPRRALRLHQSAVAIRDRFSGLVPSRLDDLRSLPGVGDYTAAAVASFAFGQRHVVLDTNVRRVLARVISGVQFPSMSPTRAERTLAASVLPEPEEDERAGMVDRRHPTSAAIWAAATMEFGALVCTARNPSCASCPLIDHCAWAADGFPLSEVSRKGQAWEGTDRQCRGHVLDLVRRSLDGVEIRLVKDSWPDHEQIDRCVASLLADGLVHADGDLLRL